MVRIFLKTLKPISVAKLYSYSPTIYSLKDYLNQHGFYKWRHSESENFDVFVYIFKSEKTSRICKRPIFS